MAFALFDEVALINGDTVGAINAFNRNGNILFGRLIIDNTGDWDVLWENGLTAQSVPPNALDKIDVVSDVVAQSLQGKVVYALPPSANSFGNVISSPEYRSIVVRVYTRQRGGEGEDATYVLLRNLQTQQLFEALYDTVTVVAGQ